MNKTKLLHDIWNKFDEVRSNQSVEYVDSYKQQLFTNLFCPGPNISFVTDFPSQEIDYIDDHVEKILGIKEKDASLESILGRVHPDDFDFVLACEEKIFWFIDQVIDRSELPYYKFSYSVRFKVKSGQYAQFLHQAVVIQQDSFGRMAKVLSLNSIIDHITTRSNKKLSMIHMNGGQSYFNVCPFSQGLNTNVIDEQLLTEREQDTVRRFAEGYNYKKVAELLNVSPNTIRTHKQNILRKLKAKNMVHVITRGIQQGWI